ncbi:MAG TPA: GYD domain-containing protein [Dehalococcoidia bacterium]|nr:GYD domain-containing protein [Dehalococcoidia bacterium]
MPTFVLLTRLSPESVRSPDAYEELNARIEEQIKAHAPEVRWVANYAILGPYDYLDVFEAPDERTAMKVSTIVRSFGHATTETWIAEPWSRFVELTHEVAGAAARA